MPKTWTLTASDDLHAASIEILPAVALLHHGLEVLHPHDAVLDGILHDRAGDPGREIAGTNGAVAEVGRHGEPAVHHRDRLGGGEASRGRLELGLPIGGHAVAQLAEDRDEAADLLDRRLLGGKREGTTRLG